MIKSFTSIFMVLLFSCTVFGQTKFVMPDQKIIGAEKPIKLGKLVRLRVGDVSPLPANYVGSTYKWKVLEAVYDFETEKSSILEIEDVEDLGNHIFFGAGIENKILYAECIIVHSFAVKDKDGKIVEVGNVLNVITSTVTIGDNSPNPNPGPKPNPKPEPVPVFPDGKFKLSAKSYDLAMKNVSAVNRKKGANAISSGCKTIASAIAAGTISDPATILKELKAKNNSNLQAASVDVGEWDAFGLGLQGELKALYKDKKLVAVADYGVALLEIAAGLDKVK